MMRASQDTRQPNTHDICHSAHPEHAGGAPDRMHCDDNPPSGRIRSFLFRVTEGLIMVIFLIGTLLFAGGF